MKGCGWMKTWKATGGTDLECSESPPWPSFPLSSLPLFPWPVTLGPPLPSEDTPFSPPFLLCLPPMPGTASCNVYRMPHSLLQSLLQAAPFPRRLWHAGSWLLRNLSADTVVFLFTFPVGSFVKSETGNSSNLPVLSYILCKALCTLMILMSITEQMGKVSYVSFGVLGVTRLLLLCKIFAYKIGGLLLRD